MALNSSGKPPTWVMGHGPGEAPSSGALVSFPGCWVRLGYTREAWGSKFLLELAPDEPSQHLPVAVPARRLQLQSSVCVLAWLAPVPVLMGPQDSCCGTSCSLPGPHHSSALLGVPSGGTCSSWVLEVLRRPVALVAIHELWEVIPRCRAWSWSEASGALHSIGGVLCPALFPSADSLAPALCLGYLGTRNTCPLGPAALEAFSML